MSALTNTVILWGVLALASLPLYFGLRRMIPGMPGLPWWMLAIGIGTVILTVAWGRDVHYMAGRYALTTLLALGVPALAISFMRKR